MVLRVTMKDIAAAANVSVATVSRIFNKLHTGDSTVRELVLDTAQSLGYTHKPRFGAIAPAGQGRRGSTTSFAIHTSVPIGTHTGDILCGVEQEASKNGHRVYFSAADHHLAVLGGDGDLEPDLGIVAAGVIHIGEMTDEFHDDARQAKVPLVQVNTRSFEANVDCVMCDNFTASYRAVTWLLQQGHRRVACIACGGPDNLSTEERAMGYHLALSHAGIPLDPAFFQRVDGYGIPDGYAAMTALAQLTPRPTAVFGVVDEVAVGAIMASKGLGLNVPHDLSVIGVNDLPMAETCDPPLTTIRILRQDMGRAAVQRLLDLIHDPEQAPRRIDVLCEFIERGSCAAPPPNLQ